MPAKPGGFLGSIYLAVFGRFGGSVSRRMPFNDTDAERLASQISDWYADSGGSVLITTSRRTGAAAAKLLEHLRNNGPEPAVYHSGKLSTRTLHGYLGSC